MEVTKTMVAEVMTDEQREQFREDYRSELAKKHVLQRQEKKLDAAISENKRKLASLELLTGGFRSVTMYRHLAGLNDYLVENYTYPFPQDPRVLSREFAVSLRNKRPYTDADMDKYSVNVAELIEYHHTYKSGRDPETFDFWLHAIYGGDWKLLVDSEAEGLGFVKKGK